MWWLMLRDAPATLRRPSMHAPCLPAPAHGSGSAEAGFGKPHAWSCRLLSCRYTPQLQCELAGCSGLPSSRGQRAHQWGSFQALHCLGPCVHAAHVPPVCSSSIVCRGTQCRTSTLVWQPQGSTRYSRLRRRPQKPQSSGAPICEKAPGIRPGPALGIREEGALGALAHIYGTKLRGAGPAAQFRKAGHAARLLSHADRACG